MLLKWYFCSAFLELKAKYQRVQPQPIEDTREKTNGRTIFFGGVLLRRRHTPKHANERKDAEHTHDVSNQERHHPDAQANSHLLLIAPVLLGPIVPARRAAPRVC